MSTGNQQAVSEFSLEIPETYNIPDEIVDHAQQFSDRTAVRFLSDDGRRVERTYADLRDGMYRFANALTELGVREEPVMHLFPRHPDAFVIQLGILATGSQVVPCSSMLRDNDIKFRANDCSARTIVVHESLLDMVESVLEKTPLEHVIVLDGEENSYPSYSELLSTQPETYDLPDLTADDPMSINYTSGTTGRPKPVLHKHRWMSCFKQINGPFWWGIDETTDLSSELLWATTGTGWAKWFWSPVGVGLTTGATQLIYDGEFNPDRYLQIMEDEGVTKLCAVPTQYRMFSNNADLSNYDLQITDFLSAGEPLNVEPIERMREHFGVVPRDGYGQTETVALVANHPDIEVKPGSMGKPLPGVGTTLIDLDEETEIDEPGEIGEIAVPIDSPAIFDEYYEKPNLDDRKFRGEYYRTGDLATFDEDGYLFFEGRADDVIISSGYRIGPFEVEDALVSHETVAEAAAVESPHDERGAVVKAYVVPNTMPDDPDELMTELQEHVKDETAPYKYPRRIEFVSELPKTSSGKIRRVELREQERQQFGG